MLPDNNNDTSAEIAALKNQLFTLLIALIVVSGTFTVYLFRQTSIAGKELAQGQQLQAVMNQNEAAIMGFVNKLVAYGEKHPDFTANVLKKYGIAPVAGVPASSPMGAAPAPAPKK